MSTAPQVSIKYADNTARRPILCRAVKDETLLVGDSLQLDIPSEFQQETHLYIHPHSCNAWIRPTIIKPKRTGKLLLKNSSKFPVFINKNKHLLQINPVSVMDRDDNVNKVYDTNRTDFSDLMPPPNLNLEESYIEEVRIDPDNRLSEAWKTRFHKICVDFKDVINPNPGRYNAYYGDIDCSINFASTPPPSIRARLPNYPHDKLKLMGKLMDDMEHMGILQKPDEAGVVPTFVVPSMLVPKGEKGQWRLVSDFTALNTHIKKCRNSGHIYCFAFISILA